MPKVPSLVSIDAENTVQPQKRKRRRLRRISRRIPKKVKKVFPWMSVLSAFLIVLSICSYLTNPFVKFTAVRSPFHTVIEPNGQIELTQDSAIQVRSGLMYQYFVWLKSGYYIVNNVYAGGKRSKSQQLADIIRDIHTLRFNPHNSYLISGDHFSSFFPRSLGIFYQSILDPRTALDATDWQNRQRIYLQTTAFALDAFKNTPALSTTIVPVGMHSVTFLNIYQPPSDTLYSLLYALQVMRSSQEIESTYPYTTPVSYTLQTQDSATELLHQFHASLNAHLNYYLQTVRDPQTGLIKKDILLSSAKDIAKRQSSFYDNVILWKTQQLAQQLQLDPTHIQDLAELKKNILAQFWSPKEGCFLEDLSPAAEQQQLYSSDWLIAFSTKFLDPANPSERKYYESCISYIQQNQLDQPFGLKYQQDMRKDREYLSVRWFAPAYGTTTIWSNWGMEYVKLLTMLYQETGNTAYLTMAQQQLNAYSNNIVKYGCYPEVYDSSGKMYQNAIYKSVCQTGWVVSYEQAQKMVEAVSAPGSLEALRVK